MPYLLIYSFLDTKTYIEKNKLDTKTFRKKTDCQTSRKINSEHPKMLKHNITYSQKLWTKRMRKILTITQENWKWDFWSMVTARNMFMNHWKVNKVVRVNLLHEKDREQQDPNNISSILTYNRFLPNMTDVVLKTCCSHYPSNQ